VGVGRTDESSHLHRWWGALGKDIASRWNRLGRRLEEFPEVAGEALERHGRPEAEVALPVLQWLADGQLPRQHERRTGFGQPAVTVFRDEGFSVDLLYWFDETISIHDHRFGGAFTIVEGQSLQLVYDFEPGEALSPGLSAGRLSCTRIETLHPGEVRLIPPGSGLVHSNVHFAFPAPTISLVVRTGSSGEEPQHFYSHGGLAFADREAPMETLKRLQGFGASCRISREAGVEFLGRVLRDAAPRDALDYIGAATSYFGTGLYLDSLIAESPIGTSEETFGLVRRYVQQLQVSLAALVELTTLTDNESRLLLALLAAGADWEMTDDLLRQLRPAQEPMVTLCGLVLQVVEQAGASGRRSASSLSAEATHYLRAASSGAGGAPSVPCPEGVATELATHRLFGPLFRFALADLGQPL